MQLMIYINLESPLILPVNYNHILQAVIYQGIGKASDFGNFMHEEGYYLGQRQYKMFQFSQLSGKYSIKNNQIVFRNQVSFEVRSLDPVFLRLLGESFWRYGITFGSQKYGDIQMELYDYTVEDNELLIRMKSPITVYSTEEETGRTYYFDPEESLFYHSINGNFFRKYQAYYGVPPISDIQMNLCDNKVPRKIVTKYKGIYITGWLGTYKISGERKYLDFLYQTGIGAKNSQGFGMFSIL